MKKKVLPVILLLFASLSVCAQNDKAELLQNLEKKNNDQVQQQPQSATLKSASRLFGAKDDLTSVITILPAGTVVSVLGSDSTYFKVAADSDQGYILKKDAVLSDAPVNTVRQGDDNVNQGDNSQVQSQQESQSQAKTDRLTFLENKYGTAMAKLLAAGKVWKGMTSDMVKDSWGPPMNINKTFQGNGAREEWEYRSTVLYIENNVLANWGPAKK